MPDILAPGKITLKDVARAAGVAWSTASYALNDGPKPVSEEVKQRVRAAALDLGYSSNLLARSLVTGRVRTLGILVPELFSFIATEQVRGIEAEAQEHGYNVVLSAHLSQPGRAEAAQRDMSARRLDGIISVSATADVLPETVGALPGLDLPFVLTYAPVEGFVADYAVVNQEQGGYLATRHLLEKGRKRIAFIGPAAQRSAARQRFDGYRRALAEAGGTVNPDLVAFTDDYNAPGGVQGAQAILAKGVRPDAVFAASDSLAAGAIRAMRQAGLRIPADIAVVGFDSQAAVCHAIDPPLTSIHTPLVEMGRWSVQRLIERLESPAQWEPHTQIFNGSLMVRESA